MKQPQNVELDEKFKRLRYDLAIAEVLHDFPEIQYGNFLSALFKDEAYKRSNLLGEAQMMIRVHLIKKPYIR